MSLPIEDIRVNMYALWITEPMLRYYCEVEKIIIFRNAFQLWCSPVSVVHA